MKFAYADPPYLGCCGLYGHDHGTDGGCWDEPDTHERLLVRLWTDFPDGWALSCSSSSLIAMSMLVNRTSILGDLRPRVGAWVKPFCAFKRGVRPCFAWEPVIYCSRRNPPHQRHEPPQKGGKQTTPKDFHAASITLKRGLTGAKPESFARWVFDLLNVQPGDEMVDCFPGTGVIGRIWQERQDSWRVAV